MRNKIFLSTIFVLLILAVAVWGGVFFYFYQNKTHLPVNSNKANLNSVQTKLSSEKTLEIKKFTSEEDFKNYLSQVSEISGSSFYGNTRSLKALAGEPSGDSFGLEYAAPTGLGVSPNSFTEGGGGGEAQRVSQTNVQVAGIDEPDIVKTDGKEIYYSPENNIYGYLPQPMDFEESGNVKIIPPQKTNGVKLIKAFPPESLAADNEIEKNGELLLDKNTLIIFAKASSYGSTNKIYGYDVSDSKNPLEKWKIELAENTTIAASRLYDNKIYLITKQQINSESPCPIKPLSLNNNWQEIKCPDIYYPIDPTPVDTTYQVFALDPLNGNIEKTVSFVGSSDYYSSTVYMSKNSLFVTYLYQEDGAKIFIDFVNNKAGDLFPAKTLEKIDKLKTYDISQASKMTELSYILEKFINSLGKDERLRIENELSNRMEEYSKEHIRDWASTAILRISISDFAVAASGKVPGNLLNQFSLDEDKNYLRVATTVGENNSSFLNLGGNSTVNDIYILDSDLKIVGSIKDLGQGEKIYSARFIGDRGYLVTFRQTDPFYVLDLTDPANPQKKGELKIPGYSSYLHPLTENKILGLGQEGSKIKISLFDVAQAENPQEIDKYTLDEYWSEILNTHHAFTIDSKHQIFFLPGAKGGYIFSYQNDKLELKKATSERNVKRAIYIDDYLYIIGEGKITVLNEKNWEKAKELEL